MSEPPAPQHWPYDPAQPSAPQWPPSGGPAEPLPYVIPERSGRPALITAVGVLSIVFASIGGFWGLITTFQALGLYMTSMMMPSVAAAQAAAARAAQAQMVMATQQSAGGVPVVGPRGMTPQEREAAVAHLARLQPLTPARKRQLDALLASSGHDMAPGEVSESGTMPQMRSDEQPPNYFVTPRGRLEVFNDRAVFYPLSGATVRATAPPEPPPGAPPPPMPPDEGAVVEYQSDGQPATIAGPATGPANPQTTPFALTAAEVQSVVQQAQAASGNALSPPQVNSLTTVLSAPAQLLVSPGSAQGAVASAAAQPDGSVVLHFSGGGSVTLGPQGNVVNVTTFPTFGGLSLNPVALGLMFVTSLALMALAVYLLVCGIMTLRQSPRARRLHLIYALIKILLEVAAGIASAWVMRDMFAGVGAGRPGWSASVFGGVVPAVIGCAYPVALLIVLNLRSVREYYNGVSGSPAAAFPVGVTSA